MELPEGRAARGRERERQRVWMEELGLWRDRQQKGAPPATRRERLWREGRLKTPQFLEPVLVLTHPGWHIDFEPV
jgi:hypothetical protein